MKTKTNGIEEKVEIDEAGLIKIRIPGNRYFFVKQKNSGAEKYNCNRSYHFIISTEGQDFKVPTQEKSMPCQCDDNDGQASWAGCRGWNESIIEAREYDDSFLLMMQQLFHTDMAAKVLGKDLYMKVLKNIEDNKERNLQECKKEERLVFKKEKDGLFHIVSSSFLTESLSGLIGRSYYSYCGKDTINWHYHQHEPTVFMRLEDAQKNSQIICYNCFEKYNSENDKDSSRK